MLTIDGVAFDIKVEITRQAEIKASDISGIMLDKSYFNDVMGTYMEYGIRLSYPLYNQGKYASLYDMLTRPVDAHIFVLPYNRGTITLTARVETVSDTLLEFENGAKYWRDCEFTIIANHPSRTTTLGRAIARGMTVLPEVTSPEIGDTYRWTGTAWERVTS